jgi:dolichol-phosphate mannosyltransferase
MDLDEIKTNGYAFQLELLYACERNLKATIVEIPIIFVDREKGQSKLGMGDIMEFFKYVVHLFIKGTTLGKRKEN